MINALAVLVEDIHGKGLPEINRALTGVLSLGGSIPFALERDETESGEMDGGSFDGEKFNTGIGSRDGGCRTLIGQMAR